MGPVLGLQGDEDPITPAEEKLSMNSQLMCLRSEVSVLFCELIGTRF